MKVQVGDKVRFLNETGGGLVARIDGNIVFVEDEDGFEVPAPIYEIVIIEKVPEKNNSGNNDVIGKETSESKNELVSENEIKHNELEDEGHDDFNPRIYLGFINIGKTLDENAKLELYLINDSNYYCIYLISELCDNSYMHAYFQGIIQPNSKLLLNDFLVRKLDVNWEIQLLLFKKGKPYPALSPVSVPIKLKANRFLKSNSFLNNDFFYQPALLIPIIKNQLEQKMDLLSKSDLNNILIGKETKQKNKNSSKNYSNSGLLEIDLHIHELIDNWDNLSNVEILQIQMDKFYTVMDSNSTNRGRKIVFIHGVGNGTLRSEISKQLNKKYKGNYYQDASFKEYGYGATMVIIK